MITIILGLIFIFFYLYSKDKLVSGYIYFFFLVCMLLPAVAGDGDSIDNFIHEVNPVNIIVLGICLILGFIPWNCFDSWVKDKILIVPNRAIKKLKIIFTILIIGSLYSIIYLAPFAVVSLVLGASEVRNALYASGESILPASIFTTIAVSFAACHIYAILFFYIACLSTELKKYRFFLVLSSMSYLVSCFAISARDGSIILPCFYLVFYLVFRNSLTIELRRKVNKGIVTIILVAFIILCVFSISRFYKNGGDLSSLYSGTVGYVTQQPYVFDDIVENQSDYWGFEVRFPLINRVLGVAQHEVNRRDNYFEWSFGTMYGDIYNSFSWAGLFIYIFIFVGYYYWGLRRLQKFKSKAFSELLLFCVYLYIVITGIFYLRAGSSVNSNIFFIVLSVIPFYTGKYITTTSIDNKNV